MKYFLAIPLVLIAACATAPPPRLGITKKPVHIEFVSDIRSKCAVLDPAAKACVINDHVYMNGRNEISGHYERWLSVRYVDYKQLGNECGHASGGPACWDENGALVYYDSPNGSECAECEAGDMLLKKWGITEKYLPAIACELGHEVMFHVFGGHHHRNNPRDPNCDDL